MSDAAMKPAAGPDSRARDAGGAAAPPVRAASLLRMPWHEWRAMLAKTGQELISDRISLSAAGCAFYATLALFPAISMVIFLYGLVFDPSTVEPQLQSLRALLPPEAFALIVQRVHVLTTQPRGTLGFGLVVSTLVTLWSSMTGTKSVLAALNIAYDAREQRGFFRFQLVAAVMTLSVMFGAILALAILVGTPAVINFVGLSAYQTTLIRFAGLGLLLVYLIGALSLLYRFGPSRPRARWHWITPGSVLATILWLAASALFSFYVGHISSYDATYGPLAAVVGVMMWFWVTVYVVLLGAELNSALESKLSEQR